MKTVNMDIWIPKAQKLLDKLSPRMKAALTMLLAEEDWMQPEIMIDRIEEDYGLMAVYNSDEEFDYEVPVPPVPEHLLNAEERKAWVNEFGENN